MKIGTLTFHRACNYGGVLQCFALVKALRSMGYDAEVIDYRNPTIESSYELISLKSLRRFISSLLSFPRSLQKRRNFRAFSQQFIPTSKTVYKAASELSDQYDFCFIGSDQVWSKRINNGFDPVYWGLFEGKKATYGASMGTDHEFTRAEYDEIRSYLANFDYLSVREDSLRDEMTPLVDKRIHTVVDPTLLLSRIDYEAIAIKPKEDNYVLYYQMQYHPKSKDFIAHIAKQLGCKVVSIMGPNECYDDVEHIHKTISQVNIQEFVGYILYAKCVVASSFHGTALPIAMRKNFYFLANGRIDRSANLLRYLDASDRMRSSTEIIDFEPVNYTQIEPKLKDFVEDSIKFIKDCIR